MAPSGILRQRSFRPDEYSARMAFFLEFQMNGGATSIMGSMTGDHDGCLRVERAGKGDGEEMNMVMMWIWGGRCAQRWRWAWALLQWGYQIREGDAATGRDLSAREREIVDFCEREGEGEGGRERTGSSGSSATDRPAVAWLVWREGRAREQGA